VTQHEEENGASIDYCLELLPRFDDVPPESDGDASIPGFRLCSLGC
jgi:hypothetical protein